MVVLAGHHREPNNNGIEERGIVDCGPFGPEIVTDIKFQLVGSGNHARGIEQRTVGAAIVITLGLRDTLARIA